MTRALMLLVVVLSGASAAQNKKVISARDEIKRLDAELQAQRELLVRILELQNECTTQMIRAARGLDVEKPTIAPAAPVHEEEVPVAATRGAAANTGATPANTVAVPVSPPRPPPAAPRSSVAVEGKVATVSGKVQVIGGGAAWVFVEDVKGPLATGAAEIRQEDKQFVPSVLAVPLGTRVAFPNLDVVFHNVFSLTRDHAFDLGMQRAGDPVKSEVFRKPGVVEIFCNIHSRMTATVLVTPGPLLARVGKDGTFKLENVPVGSHRLTAWAGGHAMSTRTVEVTPGGTTVEFEVTVPGTAPHVNKTGQPYGSYEATQ